MSSRRDTDGISEFFLYAIRKPAAARGRQCSASGDLECMAIRRNFGAFNDMYVCCVVGLGAIFRAASAFCNWKHTRTFPSSDNHSISSEAKAFFRSTFQRTQGGLSSEDRSLYIDILTSIISLRIRRKDKDNRPSLHAQLQMTRKLFCPSLLR